MDGAPWKIHRGELKSGAYGWAIAKNGTLPEGLKPRTLVKIVDPDARGLHGSIVIEVCDRSNRHWIMTPMFFEPVLIYQDSAGNRYPESHPRAIAMLQKQIRSLEREAARQERTLKSLREEIDNLTWRSTRKHPSLSKRKVED
jgi:hypothetical protein